MGDEEDGEEEIRDESRAWESRPVAHAGHVDVGPELGNLTP